MWPATRTETKSPINILPIALAAAVVARELLAMDVVYERGRYMRTVKNDPVVHY